ncbi:hypothetical protein EI036_17545 [Escherichia coli]|nr:hypothetical protein [Escherichia coli]
MFAGKKSAQIREILINESAWEEMTCLFAPSLDTDTSDRIKAVKNFLAVLSDSICSLFIVNSNVASISLGNESFSTDEDLEYGYLMNTGNHYDVYLPPELFAQAYKLNNKEMNAQLDYLNRYAI